MDAFEGVERLDMSGVEHFDFDRLPQRPVPDGDRELPRGELTYDFVEPDPLADPYWKWLQDKVTDLNMGVRRDVPLPPPPLPAMIWFGRYERRA